MTSRTTTGARPTRASWVRTSSGTCASPTRSTAVAADAGATPAQVALAWLLSKGDDIVPIPGTKRVARVEENFAADGIELSAEQIERLDNLTPAAGGHHNEEQMRLLER